MSSFAVVSSNFGHFLRRISPKHHLRRDTHTNPHHQNNRNMSLPPSIDLTATIGGRLVTPALPIVDGSPSSAPEQLFQSTLRAYVNSNVPLESTEGIQRRERVLVKMGNLMREWVKGVAVKKGLNRDAVEGAGGELFTSGSYRLGVHEPGADIGTLWSACVASFVRSQLLPLFLSFAPPQTPSP